MRDCSGNHLTFGLADSELVEHAVDKSYALWIDRLAGLVVRRGGRTDRLSGMAVVAG